MIDDLQLFERLRVRETIERYFFGVDARDESALIDCFSADAIADYHHSTPEQITVVGGIAIACDVHASCSRFTASTHTLSSFVADVVADTAEACTFAVAHVTVGRRTFIRGLRYQDRLTQNAQGWKISRRVHTPLWQIEAEAVTPFLSKAFYNSNHLESK